MPPLQFSVTVEYVHTFAHFIMAKSCMSEKTVPCDHIFGFGMNIKFELKLYTTLVPIVELFYMHLCVRSRISVNNSLPLDQLPFPLYESFQSNDCLKLDNGFITQKK